MAVKAPPDEAQRAISLALDAAFYRSVYRDVAQAGHDPVTHYAAGGWREGRDPAPWFSTRRYLAANPDVAELGLEPLSHYLRSGRREGRDVFPSEHAAAYFADHRGSGAAPAWRFETPREPATRARPPDAAERASPLADRALAAEAFDAAFYLGANPDVAEAGVDPLEHFLSAGWREGRDPSPRFSVRDYLEIYPDVAQAGLNPFVHYLRAGRAEGRKARHDLGFRYEILAAASPMEQRLAAAAEASAAVAARPAADLLDALAVSRSGLDALHVTFSHDDFTANVGGVQLCLQREAAAMAALRRDHLHLFPARPWPILRTTEAAPLGVLWNGRLVGAFAAAAVAEALGRAAAAAPPARARSFAIHSLLGHGVDETAEILGALGLRSGYFWLHDFSSLCAGYHLLRNDVQDCAAPPLDSAACGICLYGPWRPRHLKEHARLFERLDLTVVSPSAPTLELWRARAGLRAAGEVILPHAVLEPRGAAPIPPAARPFRLAFAGMPAGHKGWPVFRDLALRLAGDPRYEFLHLGGRGVAGLPMGFREINVTAQDPRAMQSALAAEAVDAVLVWPLCRETFSFTAYEAVAAGAAVLTNGDSGNVAAFVAEGGHGRVLADEAALASLFEGGEALELSRGRRRPQVFDLRFSAMTADLVGPEAAA
jgi:hypothetical protein